MEVREKLEVIAHLGYHIKYKEDVGICYDSALAKVIEDAYMALKNGVTVQQWISVKDRLPEDSTYVLARLSGGAIYQALCLTKGSKQWYGANLERFVNKDTVTHWMPLPQPPKGE